MRQQILEKILLKLKGLNINSPDFISLKESFNKVIEENKNESNEYREEIKEKYQDLLNKCNDFLVSEMTPETKVAYPYIKAIMAPLNSYVENLNKGKGLDDVLSDNSWVKGYFNKAPEFKEKAEYKEGEFKASLDINENINTYKEGIKVADDNYMTYVEEVSGDTYMPKEVLKAEGMVLQGFIDSFGKDKFECANVVTQMHEFYNLRLDPKNTKHLENGSVISESFFDVSIGQNLDWTNTDAHLSEIKGLDKENKELILSELKKLRFDGKKKEIVDGVETTKKFVAVGCTPDLLEKFEKVSYSIQCFYKGATLLTRDDDSIKRANHPANKVYKKLKEYSDRIINTLKGEEGATAPSKDEIISVADEIENYLDNFPMEKLFTRSGIDIIAFDTYIFYKDELCKLEPELLTRVEAFKERFNNKIQADKEEKLKNFLEGNYEFTNEENKERTFNNFKEYSLNGFSTMDSYYEDRFLRMAKDPEYNLMMLNKLKETISNFSGLDKSGVYSYRNNANILTTDRNEEKLPDSVVEASVKKMYLAASKLKIEHEKIARYNDKHTTFKEKVSLAPNKEVLKFVNAKSLDKKMMDSLRNVYKEFTNTSLVNDVASNMDMKSFDIESKKVDEFNAILNPSHTSLLSGRMSELVDTLTQNKRGLHSNSKEYTEIGKALENINAKNNTINGATNMDYMGLYQACTNYILSRDSYPTSQIGKDRFGAAAKMVVNLGDKIKKDFPSYHELFENNDKINMLRSKTYRDEKISLAYEKINILFNNDITNITRESIRNLSEENRTIYNESLKTIVEGSLIESELLKENKKGMITGKTETKEKMNDILSKEKKYISKANKCISEFNKNPEEFRGLFNNERLNTVSELKNREEHIDLVNQI